MRFTAVFPVLFLAVSLAPMFCVAATPPAQMPVQIPVQLPTEATTSTSPSGPAAIPETPTPQPPEVAATPLPASTSSGAFQNGLAAFQKSDFKTARQWFREVLIKDATQIVAWYDLGLSEQRLGNAGLAMAYWRKALELSPGFSSATAAIAYTKSKLERSDIPHDVETWESLRSSTLVHAPLPIFAGLATVLFFISAFLFLTFIGQRRRAILDEKTLPAFPAVAVIMSILFVGFVLLLICKIIDDQDLRGTVIAKKVDARALPDSTSTSLFELFEGLEIIVRQQQKSWIQVTYPGGATGWVARETIFTTSDRITP